MMSLSLYSVNIFYSYLLSLFYDVCIVVDCSVDC